MKVQGTQKGMSVVAVAGVTAQAVAELKAVEQASIQARIELIIKIARVVPWRMPFLRGGRRHTATEKKHHKPSSPTTPR